MVCVLAIVLLMQNEGGASVVKIASLAMLCLGICSLIADRNKKAVGIALSTLSSAYIIEGLLVLFKGVHSGQPVQAFVIIISGLLLLCGGISILAKGGVRLGGSLCIMAVAIEWIFNLYQLVNGNFHTELWHNFACITAFATLVWSYGYDSRDEVVGVRRILCIVAYVLSGIVALRGILHLIDIILMLLG